MTAHSIAARLDAARGALEEAQTCARLLETEKDPDRIRDLSMRFRAACVSASGIVASVNAEVIR